MSIGRWLGVMILSFFACAAHAQVTCAECKATALAEASQCRAHAAPDAALLATCDRRYAEMGQACQSTACRAEGASVGATQCADCVKQAEAETKKCASLPRDVRTACEARAATGRKACEDRYCAPSRK
jgi:hypothetical protein